MLINKTLPQYNQVMLEGDLSSVMDWLDSNRWAETTINVYCREGTGELCANAVCGMAAAKDHINL